MPHIHPTAIIGKNCRLADNVSIGPYAVIEENVSIGEGTVVWDHAHIGRGTTLGRNNTVHMGAVIGHEAQHKSLKGIESFLMVGDENVFREYVTVHRGAGEQSKTLIGDHNFFMAFAHIGHDCQVKNHVVITNAALLGGHVLVEDYSVLSGGCGVHQFCRIGSYAMIGGHASITKDVPPYMLVDDNQDLIGSMNIVGLRRANFIEDVKRDIKNAYKLLYLSGLNLSHAIDAIVAQCHSKEVDYLLQFMRDSKRGILGHRRQHSH